MEAKNKPCGPIAGGFTLTHTHVVDFLNWGLAWEPERTPTIFLPASKGVPTACKEVRREIPFLFLHNPYVYIFNIRLVVGGGVRYLETSCKPLVPNSPW